VATADSPAQAANGRPVFVVVDGYSLLYRAFFATPNLRTSDGRPTNALYGIANMLLRLLDEYNPQAFAVAWDAPAQTYRAQSFEAYKAHRPPTPDDLQLQIEPVRRMFDVLGLPLVEAPGYEADDVVGTLARRAADEGFDVYIVTGDTDTHQLVDEHVHVIQNVRGVSDVVVYDVPKVEERYSLRVDQVADWKALRGDPSDNIPGVSGIGDKTATKLLQEFGTLDGIYDNLDKVQPERIRRLLEEGRENAYLSQELARIHTDISLPIEPKDLRRRQPDRAAARAFFEEFQMHSLTARFADREEAAPPPSLTERATDYRVAASPADVAAFAAMVKPGGLAVIADIQPAEARNGALAGIALAAGEGRALYVPLDAAVAGELEMGGGLPTASLAPVWEACEGRVIGHHIKATLKALSAAGLAHLTPVFDTAVAAYDVDPTRSDYNLADMARTILGASVAHELLKGEKRNSETQERRRLRLMEEADLALALVAPLTEQMRSLGVLEVYEKADLPLIPILAAMERAGIAVDVAQLQRLSTEFDAAIRDVEETVYSLAGERFNIGSPKQLQTILFEKMGLPAGKKTKTGYSTDSATLEELAVVMADKGLNPDIVQGILDWRELSKLKATYTDALLALRDPNDGRIHTTFNLTVAATGRLSSSDPNLQNIPIRREVGREIRRAFVAGKGKTLISADYSQIELRVLAHYTRDPELMRAFAADEDIHTITASRIFGVPEAEVTPDQRRVAKTVNFAVLYGQSDFGLSAQLKISREAAREYISNYFARFPSVRRYLDATLQEARETGAVRTLMGRRRPVPEVHDRNRNIRQFGERAAINSPLQGTSADIIKLAMVRLDRELRESGLPATLLLQVHDELVLETAPEHVERVASLVRTAMQEAYPLAVLPKVEVKAGPNWQDMQRI
jgi:DNA polymerase-1